MLSFKLAKFFVLFLILNQSASTPSTGFRELVESVEKFKNPNADPCQDYFEYACKNKTLNRDKLGIDEKIREILTRKLLHGENLDEFQTKLQNYYISCISDKDLSKQIQEMGDWPMFNPNWENSTFDKIAAQNPLLNFVFVNAKPVKEATGHEIYLSTIARRPGPAKDYARILKKFGVKSENLDEIVDQISTMDEKFDSVLKIENAFDYKEDVLTFSELKEAALGIDWDAYFSILEKPLQPTDRIHIKSLKALVAMIHELKALDSKSIANYFVYRLMEAFQYEVGSASFSEDYCTFLVKTSFGPIVYDAVLQEFKEKNKLLDLIKWAAQQKAVDEVVSHVYEQLFEHTSDYLEIKELYGNLKIDKDNYLKNLIALKELIWKKEAISNKLMPAVRTVTWMLLNTENKTPMHVLITAGNKVLQDSTKPEEDRRLGCITSQLNASRYDFAVTGFLFMLDSIPLYDKVIDKEFLDPSGKYYNEDDIKILSEFDTNYKKLYLEGSFQKLICTEDPIFTKNKNFFLFPFKNVEEFSQVYKCPLGSVMNPENKCK